MRIGLVIYGSLDILSGGYLYDRNLVDALGAHGDQVEVIGLPWRDYGRHLLDNLSGSLVKHLAGLNLDILLQDELNHPSLFWANRRLKKEISTPVVAIVHHLRCSEPRSEWENRFYRRIEAAYLAGVDGFIFNSQTTRAVVEGLLRTSKPGLVAYPAGDRLNPQMTEGEVVARARKPGPLRVIFLGNVIARKGLHVLISALSRMPGRDWVLSVAGSLEMEPAYAASVQRQVRQAGHGDRVHFLGTLDEGRLVDLLKTQHVLAVPSFYEGFGIAYLEGMGFGLPAVAGTAGAAREIITPHQDGYLVPPGDPVALTGCLEALSRSPDLRAEMSAAALARYQRHPTWAETGAASRTFLHNLAKANPVG